MHVLSPRNIAASLASLAVLGWVVWWNFDFFSFGIKPFVVLTVLSLPAVAWWIWDEAQKSKHERQMEEFAAMHGWGYQSAGGEWSHKLSRYPFGRGTHRRDVAILRGKFAGLDCATFVHEYETRDGDSRSATQVFQVTVVKLPFPLAVVDIIPEDSWARVAKFVGGQDINFESADFNARWRVKAGNAKFAHDVLHPRMIERLNGYDAQGLALRVEGEYVLAWQAGRQPTTTLAKRLSVVCAIARLIPEHVYREYAESYEREMNRITSAEDSAPDWARSPGRLTDGKFNPELLDPKYPEKLPEIDRGARLTSGVGSYFPAGFFGGVGGGFGGFDGFGGDRGGGE